MNKFFKYKWAVDGETVAVPDAVDPSGYVSYRQGYGGDYSRVYGTDPLAKPQERTKLNAVLQDITGELQSLQVHGFPDYITPALNGGTPYAYDIGAVVRWTDNKNYINTVADNEDDPSVAGWIEIGDSAASIHSATSKITPVDADEFGIWDSVSTALRKVTFANLKATLKTYFDTLYPSISGSPSFSVYRSGSNQSISSGTYTKVQFNSEEWDTTNAFDSSTNYRFQPTSAGKYHLSCAMDCAGTSFANAKLAIYKNGTIYKNSGEARVSGSIVGCCDVDMNGSSDYVEVYVNIVATSPSILLGQNISYFQGHKIIGV